MSKPALCCDSCFAFIARRSSPAAKLWIDLCDIQVTTPNVFGLNIIQDLHTLRLLEILGFVITSDCDQLTLVKVKGKQADSKGIYFCGGKCG